MAKRRRPGASGPRRGSGSDRSGPGTGDSGYLLDAAQEHLSSMQMMYQQFEDKKPVILFDIQEQRIYAYPYADFSQDLSDKSQRSLMDQYDRAIRENMIVVFVRDNEQRRLVSFSLPYQSVSAG